MTTTIRRFGRFLALAAAGLLMALQACAAQTVVLHSHLDRTAALQVAGLAGAVDRGGLTIAPDTIPAGTPWRAYIAERIHQARTVLLLWSANAAASPEVAAEWRMALAATDARVVPLLLDDTALPPELATLQALRWRPP